jgi:hypothetical protein
MRKDKLLKLKLIELLEKNPIIAVAVQKVGIARSTFYRWMENDSEFCMLVETATNKGVDEINDIAENHLINKVKQGDSGSIKFWLTHRKNEYKYRHLLDNVDFSNIAENVSKSLIDKTRKNTDTKYY